MRRRSASMGVAGTVLAAAVLAASPMSASVAVAQEKMEKSPIPGTFSANVALTSEYLFRGLSQTDDAPALQGGLDYEVEIAKPVSLYLGLWGSNVDFSNSEGGSTDGASIEIDWYGGFRGSIGDTGLSWDLGAIYYSYPGANSSFNYDFWEIAASLGYDFGVASVTGSVNYSPDFYGSSGNAWYPKVAVDVPVPGIKGLSISAYVAKQFVENEAAYAIDKDYLEWNLAVTYNVVGWFDLSIAYADTNLDPGTADDGQTEAVIFTVSKSF